MSDILDIIKSRQSVRKYKATMVPDEDIDKIIEAGLYAASGMNRQSTIIIAVTDRAVRDRISEMNRLIGGWKDGFDPFYGAPAMLIVLADKNCPTGIYDGSLVMGNMMLEANALGIDSCWIHRAKEEFESDEGKAILKALGIEGEWTGIGHCAIGYRDGEISAPHPRKPNRVFKI